MTEAGAFRDDLAKLQVSTDLLVSRLSGLSDTEAAAASLLPGWARGHVLTHLARNADAMVNLVTWARTGEVAAMYPSAEARNADIAAGARAGPDGLAGITELVAGDERWALAPEGSRERRALHGPLPWLAAWLMGRPVPNGSLATSDGTPPPAAPAL